MLKLRAGLVGVDNGDVILFSDFEDGGEMWTGRGLRERQRHVKFGEKFRSPPRVQLSLSLWDVDASTVIRSELMPEAITAKGFNIMFRTWGDTRFARVRVSWMAIGEIVEDLDWDVDN
ncbi:MAG: H-type lectin domain-containing protein [Sulfitobacter sp.]